MNCLVCGISNKVRVVYIELDQSCGPCFSWESNYRVKLQPVKDYEPRLFEKPTEMVIVDDVIKSD